MPDIDPAQNQNAENVKKEAFNLGWREKEQFNGDPENWVDAPTFVKKGKEIMPLLKANNKRLETDLSATKGELAQLRETVKKFANQHDRVSKDAYDKALETVRAEKAEAINNSDGVRFAELEADENVLLENKPAPAEPGKDPAEPRPPSKDFNNWQAKNEWHDPDSPVFDEKMRAYAIGCGADIMREGTANSEVEFLGLIEAKVKELFPHKFENPKRNLAGPVDGGDLGGDSTTTQSGDKSWGALPDKAKEDCKRFIRDGLYGDKAAQEFKDGNNQGEVAKAMKKYVTDYPW